MRKIARKSLNYFYKSPILSSILLSCLIALIYYILVSIKYQDIDFSILIAALMFGFLLVLPVVLTIENIIFLIVHPRIYDNTYVNEKIEVFTLCLGSIFSIFLFSFLEIKFQDWNVQLSNNQLHSPIFLKAMPTILILLLISFIGYFLCRFINLEKKPPLVSVISISSMYIGVIISILWCIQVKDKHFLLMLLPINYIIIIFKTIRSLIYEKSISINKEIDFTTNEKFPKLNKLISNYSNWPWIAAIITLPLLGVIIMILILLGQKPNSIIKAWTETADWTFSQKVPPQSIYYDEHYLCTVAAGGHKEVVKPIREGKRHGHKVLVNRQLCIANAFEQILEERLPKIHKIIRNFYDKYGYPIATKIKSPYTADVIYFLMKPLEWIFLIVLYLFDTKPEDRIAIQYPHSKIPKF